MSNIFGTGNRIIFYNGSSQCTLPYPSRGYLYENFIEVKDEYTDFDREDHEESFGYKMICKYRWKKIDPSDLDNIIKAIKYKDKSIKFPNFTRRFPFLVTKFDHNLREGLESGDSCILEIKGKILVAKRPRIDDEVNIIMTTNSFIIGA